MLAACNINDGFVVASVGLYFSIAENSNEAYFPFLNSGLLLKIVQYVWKAVVWVTRHDDN